MPVAVADILPSLSSNRFNRVFSKFVVLRAPHDAIGPLHQGGRSIRRSAGPRGRRLQFVRPPASVAWIGASEACPRFTASADHPGSTANAAPMARSKAPPRSKPSVNGRASRDCLDVIYLRLGQDVVQLRYAPVKRHGEPRLRVP